MRKTLKNSVSRKNSSKKSVSRKKYSRKNKINKMSGGERLQSFIERIKKNNDTSPTEFNINKCCDNTWFANYDIFDLIDAIAKNNTLKSLNLSRVSKSSIDVINSYNLQILAEALKQNKTLTKLTTLIISSNYISDEGAKAIAEVLENNITLTSLDMNGNNITDEGAKAIAEALKKNTTLTTLNIKHNDFGIEGIKALADMLKHNSTLTILDMNFNNISDEEAKVIAGALEKNKTLTSLNISHNKIGIEGVTELVKALENNKESAIIELLLYNVNLVDNEMYIEQIKRIDDILVEKKEKNKSKIPIFNVTQSSSYT